MAATSLTVASRAVNRALLANHSKFGGQMLCQYNRRLLSSSAKKPSSANAKLILKGAGLGVGLGIAWAVYDSVKGKDAHIAHEEQAAFIIDKLPDVPITRKIVNPNDKSNLELVLFQYQTCPFCCKVRAFLDSNGLSYSIVEVDAVLRQGLKWSPTKRVPTLLARTKEGKYVQLSESSAIISILATVLQDPSADVGELAKFYPKVSFLGDDGKKKHDVLNKYFLMYEGNVPKGTTKEIMAEERKWRTWTDEHLIHLISPNVYRTKSEALETFEWFSEAGEWDTNFPRWERNLMVYTGAAAMYLISKRLKKRHNLSDDVRDHMYNACNKWVQSIEGSQYHGGKTPDLADMAVFGALNSFEGCQAFADTLANTNIGPWFNAMKAYADKNRGTVIRAVSTQNA